MGIILIGIILFIVGIYFLVGTREIPTYLTLYPSSLILIFSFIVYPINKPKDIEKFNNDYCLILEEIEIYKNSNLKTNYHYIINLENRINEINERIKYNREHKDSYWIGYYCFEEISEYEEIDTTFLKL